MAAMKDHLNVLVQYTLISGFLSYMNVKIFEHLGQSAQAKEVELGIILSLQAHWVKEGLS